ncbi:hypothetical protein P4E94_03145 [Pontiellaceae bacterium B12219]|nr:hypothetical protein [Pontiellaceae bacterium B12219]
MKKTMGILSMAMVSVALADSAWVVDSQAEWEQNIASKDQIELNDGMASPTAKTASFQSKLKRFADKRSAESISFEQSTIWENWEPAGNIGPSNLGGAPIFLRKGDQDYWIFGMPKMKAGKRVDGYHGWQSRDMVNWTHYGPVTPKRANCATSAELVDGNVYIYYDFPNDQDPHLVIDEDLTDGIPGKDMGMAFKDPSHGSDSAIIRDLDGNFHLILEDWSPIDASTHAWDSPLAMHAVSADGIKDFKILPPAVDERTTPTGKFAEYFHPHWTRDDPENYPGKPAPKDFRQHRIKKGDIRASAQYEIHEPEQNAYGDWAAISIGGQYYLFCDFDPSTAHGDKNAMSVAWFTSDDINKPFTFCGNVGKGHPDPDIMFAEGKFYLLTQTPNDFVSPGPWVDGVEVRVGVDVSNDGKIDQWTDWKTVKESYEAVPGFAKQVARIPASLGLSELPAGYGFQFEVKLTDTTANHSKPMLEKIELSFAK